MPRSRTTRVKDSAGGEQRCGDRWRVTAATHLQQQPPKPSKQKAHRKLPQVIMDDNQIMIPGNMYQTWLKDTSNLVSKRRKVNTNFGFIQSTKISDLMDMPPVALISFSEICSLMENMRWKQELTEWTSQMALSAEYDSAYDTLLSDHSVAIGSRSANAIRKWKVIVHLWSKRQHSSGRSLGNLDPVDEDFPLEQEVRDLKMRRLSDFGQTPDLLEETEPTQTPYEKRSDPINKVIESI